MGVGPKKGTTMYVARAVCQKQRVTFDKTLRVYGRWFHSKSSRCCSCFYKFRTVLNLLCSQGNIVDAGPLGTFRPTFTAKAVEKEEDFKPATHIKKTMVLFRPSVDFRTLHDVEYFKIPAYDKTKGKKKPEGGGGSQPHP